MNAKLGTALVAVFGLGAGNTPAPSQTIIAPPPAAEVALVPVRQFSVLTYNVQGLPWPVANGRPEALTEIAERLRAMRARGTAPDIVVLQEAFTRDAVAIGNRAGYRFQALGPSDADARSADAGPQGTRNLFKGEVAKPWLSSGLIILSDFPISDIRRTVFPTSACAGYDCLANKGVLSAQVAMPGAPAPVEIVTTHLNSAKASGQPEPVSRGAWRRQLESVDHFLDTSPRMGRTIRIFAGDLNVGHSPERLTLLFGYIRHWRMKSATAMGRHRYMTGCTIRPADCIKGVDIHANVPLVHANDWQLYLSSGDGGAVRPVGREVAFGRDRAGKMLSDHIGFSVTYRFD